MERTQALEDGAGLLEGHALGDEVDEVDLLFDGFGCTNGRRTALLDACGPGPAGTLRQACEIDLRGAGHG